MNRLNSLLTILISLLLGAFAGLAGGAYMHYRTFEALYVEQSAPWYFKLAGILLGLLVLAILCMFLKILLRRRRKEKEQKVKERQEKEQAAEQQEN